MTSLIQLLPEMGPAVLRHLSQFVEPSDLALEVGTKVEEGFVAGQAVASALSELFGDGSGVVYNDVDVFLLSDEFSKAKGALTTLEFDVTTLGMEYRVVTAQQTTVYDVCATVRKDMLNQVKCKPLVRFREMPTITSSLFLQSFDLNCVQVGVRLSDQQLVWTPAFEQFLATREMLVMNVKTPLHTAVRWFRKKAELEGIFGHDDKTMELLTAMEQRVRKARASQGKLGHAYRRTLEAQSMFGKLYAEKARGVESELGKYFELRRDTEKRVELYSLHGRNTPDKRLLDTALLPDGVLPLYARAMQGHWKRHTNAKVMELFHSPRPGFLLSCLKVEGVQALKAVANPQDERMLEKTLDDHPLLGRILRQGDTVRRIEMLRQLKALSKVEGAWVYGLFEQISDQNLVLLDQCPTEGLAEQVRHVYVEQKELMEKWAREGAKSRKRALRVELGGFRVKELTTFRELVEEGIRMHHCVAGYFQSVLSGQCRIFALQRHRTEDCVTLELRQTGKVWSVVQARGLVNRSATAEEKETARLVGALCTFDGIASAGRFGLPAAVLQGLATRFAPKLTLLSEHLAKRQSKPSMLTARKHWNTRHAKVQTTMLRWVGNLPAAQFTYLSVKGAYPSLFVGLPWTEYVPELLNVSAARLKDLASAFGVGQGGHVEKLLPAPVNYGYEDVCADIPF